MRKVDPVFLVELFPKINSKLLQFLKDLSYSDWERQTISPRWKIKDVAAHLVDGNFRRISVIRDDFFLPSPGINDYSELVDYLNQLNADWVQACQRLSPQILIELLGKLYYLIEKLRQIRDRLGFREPHVRPSRHRQAE